MTGAPSPSAGHRRLSGLEFLLGAGIVVGHNVLGVLPNEVPILFGLGLLSARVRNGGWAAIGLKRPKSWLVVLGVALAAAATRLVLGGVIESLAAPIWPPSTGPSGVEAIHGNLGVALSWLAKVWTFAAFGEEIGYRGYLITRAAEALNGSRLAWWVAMFAAAILFGLGHFYKGPTGMIDSGVSGLVLGTAYFLTGRTLWTAILAHGFIDSFGVIALYFGAAL